MAKHHKGQSQPRVHGLTRDAQLAAKKKLAKALTEDGVDWAVKVIRSGPWAADIPDDTNPLAVPAIVAQQVELWKWAMTYAGDRAGLPKMNAVSVQGGDEVLPEITVKIVGHARPADV